MTSPTTGAASTPSVSVVLFDMDDTLLDHYRAVADGVAAQCREFGGALAAIDPTDAMALWHRLEEHHYTRYLDGELTLQGQGQRRVRVHEFTRAHGLKLSDSDADGWYGAYLAHYDQSWVLHHDTMPCLDELEHTIPGVRFGVITNAELSFQVPKLQRLGLSPRMQHVVGSGDFGYPKPDPRIFLHACALFGVHPWEAAYVGDRLHTDARGAHDAGLTGVWIDRGIATPTGDEVAEATAAGVLVASTLADVPALLRART